MTVNRKTRSHSNYQLSALLFGTLLISQAAIAGNKVVVVPLFGGSELDLQEIQDMQGGAYTTTNETAFTLSSIDKVIISATVDTPTSGYVMAQATVRLTATSGATNSSVRCSLGTNTVLDFNALGLESHFAASQSKTLTMTRGFTENKAFLIIGGDDNEMTVNLVCDGPVQIKTGDAAITLTFVADPDAFGFIIVLPLSLPDAAEDAAEGAL